MQATAVSAAIKAKHNRRGFSPQTSAAALAFLTAAITLFSQVLVHRMVSVKLLNNYAFLVISLTMLGFAFSGVVLSRWLGPVLQNLDDALTLCAAGFAVTTIAASALFYHADGPYSYFISRPDFVLGFLGWMPYALLYAVPFAFCGLILGTLLSSPSLRTPRVYFFDLLGSACGAFLVIPAISYVGVEKSTLIACALMLGGAVVFTRPKRTPARVAAAAALLVIAASALLHNRVFNMYYAKGSILHAAQVPGTRWVVEHVAWDPLARIEVSRIPPVEVSKNYYPSLVGSNPAFLARFKRMLTQNNYAYTYAVDYDGNRKSLDGIDQTLYAAAYEATSVPKPRVAAIGVGGGFDVLTAIYFNASGITGIEINAATVGILTRTYRDYFRNWVEDPRVHLVHAEGRNYLTRSQERFDVIQLSGVDSYSGTPGAANVFSENYLYTSEAFDLYLSRLTDNGILNMMRLEFDPPREMLKAMATAVGALRRAGVQNPADHIMTATQVDGHFTALLVKKTPFTTTEQQRFQEWASRSKFFAVSSGPRLNAGRRNMYQIFLSLNDPGREAAFIRVYGYDISPSTDVRPFFFRHSFWWHVFPRDFRIWADVPVMEYSVLLLLTAIGLASLVCIYLPLRYLEGKGRATSGAWRYGLFFAGTGVGYLAIEIALLQKFGLFLGHPNYALSVVLASLLLASGLGSLFSKRIVSALGELRFVSYALAAIVLAEYLLVFPLLTKMITLPFSLRVLLVFLLVAPIGLCLGTFLPSALERLKGSAPQFVPWAWGINGIFSVMAPVLSVALSMSWGIHALLLSALPVYLVVGWALPQIDGLEL